MLPIDLTFHYVEAEYDLCTKNISQFSFFLITYEKLNNTDSQGMLTLFNPEKHYYSYSLFSTSKPVSHPN